MKRGCSILALAIVVGSVQAGPAHGQEAALILESNVVTLAAEKHGARRATKGGRPPPARRHHPDR